MRILLPNVESILYFPDCPVITSMYFFFQVRIQTKHTHCIELSSLQPPLIWKLSFMAFLFLKIQTCSFVEWACLMFVHDYIQVTPFWQEHSMSGVIFSEYHIRRHVMTVCTQYWYNIDVNFTLVKLVSARFLIIKLPLSICNLGESNLRLSKCFILHQIVTQYY